MNKLFLTLPLLVLLTACDPNSDLKIDHQLDVNDALRARNLDLEIEVKKLQLRLVEEQHKAIMRDADCRNAMEIQAQVIHKLSENKEKIIELPIKPN